MPTAFVGLEMEPTGDALAKALGTAKPLWDRLLTELRAEKTIDAEEWSCYSRKAGWSLKLKHGGRTILYLAPCEHSFRASFALGDKAVKVSLASKLPVNVLKLVREAKRYAEGTAVRIEVRSVKDLEAVKKLAAVKLAN